MDTTRIESAIVPAEQAGRRLDQALAALFPEFSRSRLKRWIDAGRVTVDGRVPRPRDPVAGGERIELQVALEPDDRLSAEPIPLDIVHEDDAVIVIDKPAGLVMHPGAGNASGTLANALLAHDAGLEGLPRAGIVHRLDKDTSGLVVVARTLAAHTALVRALAERTVRRVYLAVCVGVVTAGSTVDAPIGRHPRDRTRMTVRSDGRPAVSRYRVRQRFRRHTLLDVRLETGRTHQIRVHLAHAGFPLVGDPVYGRRPVFPPDPTPTLRETLGSFSRQALHARELGFAHPQTGEERVFTREPPADFARLVAALAEDAVAAGR